MKRGVTLLELLVAAILAGMIVSAISTLFNMAVKHQLGFGKQRVTFEQRIALEDQIRDLLEHAYFDTIRTDGTSYFHTGTSQSQTSDNPDTLTFTVLGGRPRNDSLKSDETDFTERNRTFGASGGLTEVSLSMTPVGDSGGQSGLFLRTQSPADANADQGGYEQCLSPDIAQIGFEFLDGSSWITSWDAQSDQGLPPAVRVTYRLTADEDMPYSFVVTYQAAAEAAAANVQGANP